MENLNKGKWGSFFVEKSVDELVNAENADYEPPKCLIQFPSLDSTCVHFGKEALGFFPLDPQWYGCCSVFLSHLEDFY
jgi:hypothetical protein